MISKHVARMENHLTKLDMLHAILGREIVDSKAALTELKLLMHGQRELPLTDSTTKPSSAPLDPSQELCTCGHTWEEHHTEGGAEVECGNSFCRCAQFVGTGKPG